MVMKLDALTTTIDEDLLQIRSRICNLILIATAILVIPAVAGSLYRSVNIGWQWVMGLHVITAALIWVLMIFRNSISYNIRAGSLVFLYLFVGLAGFWEYGVIAGANPVLLISPVLATLLFGKRLGAYFAIVMVLLMIGTAYSFLFGGRVLSVDFTIGGPHIPAWITYLLTVILVVATSIVAISMSNHHLASALLKSRQSQNDLTNLNKDLEHQVLQRTLELEEAKKKAEQQARTDVLTGLNNRRAFFEYAEVIDAQSRRYNHAYVIAMMDIDHFKSINDTWGHEAGDTALIAVGGVISDMLRETDIIGRIGGEEFAIILPETTIEEATALAERLRQDVETTVIQTSKAEIKVTMSIGIAAFDNQTESLDNIVASADTAMYRAKSNGRNRVELHQTLADVFNEADVEQSSKAG